MYFENESCLYFRIFENTLPSIVLTQAGNGRSNPRCPTE